MLRDPIETPYVGDQLLFKKRRKIKLRTVIDLSYRNNIIFVKYRDNAGIIRETTIHAWRKRLVNACPIFRAPMG